MRTTPLVAATLCAVLAAAPAFAQHQHHGGGGNAAAPYAGMQSRAIKALSDDEVRQLRSGHGMHMALPAELNGYAGPAHVLEHADALKLDAAQRAATESLMAAHKARARELGAALVEAEAALDRSFAEGRATDETVARQTRDIARLQGELRAEHLRTHLRQNALLTPQQRAHYQRLRGYVGDSTSDHRGHHQ